MRYRLRTLLIVLAVGPVVLAITWMQWRAWLRTTEEGQPVVEYFFVGETKLEPPDCWPNPETVSPLP